MTARMTRWTPTLTLLALMSLSLVSADALACDKDTDCKGDRVCASGACVDPGAGKPCEMDTDCPGDEVCADGTCGDEGRREPTDEPIPPRPREPAAQPAQAAAAAPLPAGRCASDLDCLASQMCEANACVQRTELYSSGLMVAGIVGTGIGVLGVAAGLAIWGTAQNQRDKTVYDPISQESETTCTNCRADPGQEIAGATVAVVSGVVLITGIIFAIAGATEVDVEPAETETAVTIEPLIGPTGGGLRVRF